MSATVVIAVPMLASLLVGAPSLAAVRLDYKTQSQMFEDGKQSTARDGRRTIFIDDTRAISETEGRSVIVNTEKGEITLIHHRDKIYEIAKLPFRLEDYATETQKKELVILESVLASTVEIKEGEKLVKTGPWQAREAHVEVTAPLAEIHMEIELRLSTDPDVNYEVFDARSRALHALDPLSRGWSHRVVALAGMAVYQKTTIVTGRRKRVVVSELVSVEKAEIPVEKLRPPSDYREVPFDITRHFGFGKSPSAGPGEDGSQ